MCKNTKGAEAMLAAMNARRAYSITEAYRYLIRSAEERCRKAGVDPERVIAAAMREALFAANADVNRWRGRTAVSARIDAAVAQAIEDQLAANRAETIYREYWDEPSIPGADSEDYWRGVAEANRQRLRRALRSLTERQRIVVKLKYGLDGHDPRTLKEVGVLIRRTPELVRQNLLDALDALREALNDRLLQ